MRSNTSGAQESRMETENTVGRIIFCLLLPALLLLTGCEPFENAERLFPLPDNIWDKAVPVKNIQVFEIKNISEQEFINLKVLLLADGCKEENRDFYFSAKKDGMPLTIKAGEGILLIGKKLKDKDLYPAAFYLKRKNILLLGIGIPEK